jgi:hypothetical protein
MHFHYGTCPFARPLLHPFARPLNVTVRQFQDIISMLLLLYLISIMSGAGTSEHIDEDGSGMLSRTSFLTPVHHQTIF